MSNQRTCKPFEKPRNKPVIICESTKSDARKLQDQKINQPSRIKKQIAAQTKTNSLQITRYHIVS